MKTRRIVALMAAMLVVGLVAGNVVSGVAAPAAGGGTQSPAAAACSGLGLRLGSAMRDAGGRLADIVAKLTGQDVEDVQAQRAEGESFADIAEAEGVESSKVVDEALKVRKQLLDERVEAGTLTQDQADAAIEQMESRLTERVDSTAAGCNGSGGGRGGAGRGMGGGCGGACGQAPAAIQ